MNKIHYSAGVLLLLLFDISLNYEGFYIMKSAFVHYANYGWTFRVFNILILLLALLQSNGGFRNLFGAFQYMIVNLWKDLCQII